MTISDPNREQLLRVAVALDDFLTEVVFVGGATLGLLISDAAAPRVRPTDDVDIVVEVMSYVDYELSVAVRLRELGFVVCTDEGAPVCAWQLGSLRVDVMPTNEKVLGFSNRWYEEVLRTADVIAIDGISLRVVSPACFIATKLVAFASRGEGDYYASQDLEDIVVLINGRPEVIDDLKVASADVRAFVCKGIRDMLSSRDFLNALPGHVESGRDLVVAERLQHISAIDGG
jgi:predicted nucleotidyltransferase